MMNKKVLTIAGSDSGGGAGIQADLKTMCAYNVYGMSVITAVTAQNTLGVQQVQEISGEMVAAQLSSILNDIHPDAVKIGMVYSRENVEVIAEAIDRWELKNIVLDPVMVSTSGRQLLREDAAKAMQRLLFPRATLVTPNVPEAEVLADAWTERKKTDLAAGQSDALDSEKNQSADGMQDIRAEAGKEGTGQFSCGDGKKNNGTLWMEEAARKFAACWNTAFLIKGGHLKGKPADYLYYGGNGIWFPGERIETRHTHGTGCTLSSAIACGLANGRSVEEAVKDAKEYLTGCISHNPGIGRGHGPLNHLWRMENGGVS